MILQHSIMASNQDITQQDIDNEAEESQMDTLWGKPANDILNGRDATASAKPVRAIWEMVQNARDVSNGVCHIVFTRRTSEFEFKHDGLPFTNKTLDALILQTSSKVREDIDQVGQYGTGFLTTHLLGRKFVLASALQLKTNAAIYANFDDLEIDRTPLSKEDMVKSIHRQFEKKKGYRSNMSIRNNVPSEWTVFRYMQPNARECANTSEAFVKSPSLVPYVMTLNDSIKSIRYNDEVDGSYILFENEGKKRISHTSILLEVIETTIIVTDSKGKSKTEVVALNSKDTITTKSGKRLPKVTVLMPLSDCNVIDLSSDVTRLFLYLPLIGTECWGVNFIINSPVFTCATDNRSSIKLIEDGQSDNTPVMQNREVLELATKMIFDYVAANVTKWNGVHHLASVGFDIHNPNEVLSSYYKELKNQWISQMSTLTLVEVTTDTGKVMKSPSEIFVLSYDVVSAVSEYDNLLPPLYHVLQKMHKDLVPSEELLIYWSSVFSQWYENETCTQIVTLDQIIEFIHINGLTVVSEVDLYAICNYLKRYGKTGYFSKNILLTEDGVLMNGNDGLNPVGINDVLKSSIKILLSDKTRRFIHPDFVNFKPLTEFGTKDIKDCMSICTDALQERIKKLADVCKSTFISGNRTLQQMAAICLHRMNE